jgi:2'-5' RNA ligase
MSKKDLYFLALIPPENLKKAVKSLKEEMRDRFGAGHALKSPAHITLQMPFKRPAEQEADMIRQLADFALGEEAFQVQLSGFGCFAPRVIYVDIARHEAIVQLHRRLQAYLIREMAFSTEEVGARFHPHMTIATRDLRKGEFRKAWQEFETRSFDASFLVDSLYLLKHNGRQWDIYRQLEFGE